MTVQAEERKSAFAAVDGTSFLRPGYPMRDGIEVMNVLAAVEAISGRGWGWVFGNGTGPEGRRARGISVGGWQGKRCKIPLIPPFPKGEAAHL